MSSYQVTDNRPQLGLAALRDTLGRTHVVRLSAEIPAIGVHLEGSTLHARQASLLVASNGQVFAVTVEALECPEQYVFERMHAALQAP